MLRVAAHFLKIVIQFAKQYLVGTQQLRVIIKSLLLPFEYLCLILGDAYQTHDGVLKPANATFEICHLYTSSGAILTPFHILCYLPARRSVVHVMMAGRRGAMPVTV